MPLSDTSCRRVLAGAANAAALCDELVRSANEQEDFSTFNSAGDYLSAGLALVCMLTAGLAAGLTMGVVSLDHLDLRIKERGESAEQRVYAQKLLPLIQWKPRHPLLHVCLCHSESAELRGSCCWSSRVSPPRVSSPRA